MMHRAIHESCVRTNVTGIGAMHSHVFDGCRTSSRNGQTAATSLGRLSKTLPRRTFWLGEEIDAENDGIALPKPPPLGGVGGRGTGRRPLLGGAGGGAAHGPAGDEF